MARHLAHGAPLVAHRPDRDQAQVHSGALLHDARRYVPELTADDIEPGHSGIRAQALARDGRLIDDFVFSQTGRVLHVRNAPSPAATASLAIAREIAGQVEAI